MRDCTISSRCGWSAECLERVEDEVEWALLALTLVSDGVFFRFVPLLSLLAPGLPDVFVFEFEMILLLVVVLELGDFDELTLVLSSGIL